MSKPDHIREVFLSPGDLYFGDRNTRIKTILGSCVSIVLWHPKRHIGGMCHYMLPGRAALQPGAPLDGKYADEAMEILKAKARAAGTQLAEYQTKIFGGGNMFPAISRDAVGQGKTLDCKTISCKNKVIAEQLAKQYQLNVTATDLGETGHRQIIFELWNGHVWVRRVNACNHRC
jgi:chemotaxis protein CheD